MIHLSGRLTVFKGSSSGQAYNLLGESTMDTSGKIDPRQENIQKRTGEKVGWIGGWLGTFLWLGILATLWLFQGLLVYGLVGAGLFVLAVVMIFLAAPWRYPSTPYYKLILPLYGVLLAAVGNAVLAFGGLAGSGLKVWNLFWLFWVFTPLLILGRKRWNDVQ